MKQTPWDFIHSLTQKEHLSVYFFMITPLLLRTYSHHSSEFFEHLKLHNFFIISDTCSSVEHYSSCITPLFTCSVRKRTWICLLLPCNAGFLDNFMVELSSQNTVVLSPWLNPISWKMFLIQTAWQAPLTAAMNSAHVVDIVTICYFFDAQQTAPLRSMKTYPDMLFLSSTSPA